MASCPCVYSKTTVTATALCRDLVLGNMVLRMTRSLTIHKTNKKRARKLMFGTFPLKKTNKKQQPKFSQSPCPRCLPRTPRCSAWKKHSQQLRGLSKRKETFFGLDQSAARTTVKCKELHNNARANAHANRCKQYSFRPSRVVDGAASVRADGCRCARRACSLPC